MVVLDTNVLSELMKQAPAARVVQWVASHPATSLFTTSITYAEIAHGIMLLPAGRRRSAIETAAEVMFKEEFAGRLLPFDYHAAPHYAQIAAVRQRRGRPISHFDAQIAAIARTAGAIVATRNVNDFEE